jgi:hypothetical protein
MTTGIGPYVVPEVLDTDPNGTVIETTITTALATVDIAGGLLDNAVVEGGLIGPDNFDTKYSSGEMLLAPATRADVVAAIPDTASGVLTLWTQDYERTGLGFADLPTVPVMHLQVGGAPVSPACTIAANTPLRASIAGQPADEPGQLQFYLDGKPSRLTTEGLALDGHRVSAFDADGAVGLRVDWAHHAVLQVTPKFWNNHHIWYMNVSVPHTHGDEGIMGSIPKESWLPTLQDCATVGPMPHSLHDRWVSLYQTFADGSDKLTDLTPAGPLNTVARGEARDEIDLHEPPNNQPLTSIGAGLQEANAELTTSPIAGDYDIKATVVFTDGYQTQAPYINQVSDLITERVYAVGIADADKVHNDTLVELANNSNGNVLVSGALEQDDDLLLEKFFIQILAGVTNQQMVSDPSGWLSLGAFARIMASTAGPPRDACANIATKTHMEADRHRATMDRAEEADIALAVPIQKG